MREITLLSFLGRRARGVFVRVSCAAALLGVGGALMLLSGPVAAAEAGGPRVTLNQQGKVAVLENGLITATLQPDAAQVVSIKFRGHEMVNNTGRHRNIYFSRDGGASYETVTHCAASVTTQTPETVDVSCRHVYTPAAKDKAAWDVDVHYVMRRGVPGLYVYAVTSHEASYPELGVGEWRMVWSTPEDPKDVLEKIYVDELRHWEAPTPQDMGRAEAVPGAPKEVTRLTTGSWKGRLDCKYMYAANYWDLGCWGFASDRSKVGAWVVLPSHEYFNDGPTKQDLTAAVGTTLLHLNMNHYDGTSFHVKQGESWRKVYGPWLLYFNEGADGDACWADAKARAEREAEAWPYEWVKNADYPLEAQRGGVSGQLVVKDRLKPDVSGGGAWVGLAAPEHGPDTGWQWQATAYQYWVHTDAEGKFTVPHVRPGEYTLYAFTRGAVGEFARAGVTVRAGAVTHLGELRWDVPHHGSAIAWEIGVPDRTAAEFRHGKDYFLPLLYQELPRELPNPLEYTVGKSDWSRDWNYAQPRGVQGERAAPYPWRIHFELPRAPAGEGTATLTLAIAGAQRAKLAVDVNDEGKPVATISPADQGGNGLVREAVHTKYSVTYVPIPANRLRAGANTITLTQEGSSEDAYVMYDYVSLEVP